MEKGYIPCDSVREATSIAMEYAVDDWCIAQMAKKMGNKKDYTYFSQRADYYKNMFDKEIKLMRGKNKDGTFQVPFSPFKWGDAFTEGNSRQ